MRSMVGHEGTECVIWPYCRIANGYGMLGYMGEMRYPHRMVCELVHGPSPVGKNECRHLCGNGHLGCVNPKHLAWGSKSENGSDRRRHGTWATSKYGPRSPLTREQIMQVRALKGKQTQATTAKQFGISEPSVRRWQKTTTEPKKTRQSNAHS